MKKSALLLLVLPLCIAGCASRNHLTSGHGRSYHEALARQAANPEAGNQSVASKGLDPEEAAVIAQGYRTSLAPKGEKVEQEPILLVAPSAQKAGARGDYMPPASVPQER
jgi:type IV pilus biogenesis protein CpaD/CtpE